MQVVCYLVLTIGYTNVGAIAHATQHSYWVECRSATLIYELRTTSDPCATLDSEPRSNRSDGTRSL